MLLNRTIVVPETRQEALMAQLLENRGAEVMRVPMVAIYDSPHPDQVLSWIKQFIARPPQLFIIFTGEGMHRLLALAERNSLKESFIKSLSQVTKLCRGPKPVRVLRELGLSCDIPALAPTTDGIIASLQAMDIDGDRIAVQLYGAEPNEKLMTYLMSRKVEIERVAPYVYAGKAEDAKVVALIKALERQEVCAIAFTSQSQFKRLLQVARAHDLESSLLASLTKIKVAAVGPLVKEQLLGEGVQVHIMPEKSFFMKPLANAIIKYLDIFEKPV